MPSVLRGPCLRRCPRTKQFLQIGFAEGEKGEELCRGTGHLEGSAKDNLRREKKNFPPVRRNLFKGIKIIEKYFYQEKKDKKPNHLELRGQAPELQISWPRLTSKRLGHPAGPNCF